MIAAKKIWLKDKAEEMKQGKKKLKHKETEMLLKKKEESEGLRSKGSQKDQRITEHK